MSGEKSLVSEREKLLNLLIGIERDKEIEQRLGMKPGDARGKVNRKRAHAPPPQKNDGTKRISSIVLPGILISVILIVVVLSFTALNNPSTSGSGGNQAGDAPAFTLTATDGSSFALSDFSGKVVVLDLMATWCSPCRSEMSHLSQVQSNFGDNVVIISISVGGDTVSDLSSFKQSYGVNWRFAVDDGSVLTNYSATSIPKIVIIDENQNIAFTHVGLTSAETLMSEISTLL